MVGAGTELGDADCGHRFRIGDERWNKPLLLLGCHGPEQVRQLPALVEYDCEAEIADSDLLAGDAHGQDVGAGASKLFRYAQRA